MIGRFFISIESVDDCLHFLQILFALDYLSEKLKITALHQGVHARAVGKILRKVKRAQDRGGRRKCTSQPTPSLRQNINDCCRSKGNYAEHEPSMNRIEVRLAAGV